jgi:hypothetical protein
LFAESRIAERERENKNNKTTDNNFCTMTSRREMNKNIGLYSIFWNRQMERPASSIQRTSLELSPTGRKDQTAIQENKSCKIDKLSQFGDSMIFIPEELQRSGHIRDYRNTGCRL